MFLQILAVILEGHDILSKQTSTALDPFGRTVTVVPVLAGIVGDNMEIQRWLHGKSNTCHVCTRCKQQLGDPGYKEGDRLKCTHEIRIHLSVIASQVLTEDHQFKNRMKTNAKNLCQKLDIHPSALHPDMAPLLKINYFNAHQQVVCTGLSFL